MNAVSQIKNKWTGGAIPTLPCGHVDVALFRELIQDLHQLIRNLEAAGTADDAFKRYWNAQVFADVPHTAKKRDIESAFLDGFALGRGLR